MSQIDLKDATFTFSDGTAVTPLTIDIKIGEGNLTFTERVEREYTLDRGNLDEVRNGDQTPVDVSLDFVWEYIKGTGGTGVPPTPIDVLKQIGAASTWVSTDSDLCRPYAIDVIITYAPQFGTSVTETITLPDFRYEELGYDLRAGTISCSGKCNVTQATEVRS